MKTECKKCRSIGPDGQAHHRIVVENGQVMRIDCMSGDGYWDRELEQFEYFVEYKDIWLEPKLYHGKSMCELGECDCADK